VARILLIDDNESLRTSLRRTLVRAGHDVTDVPGADAALREYRRERPDLVITDIVMPDKEGLETIRELRKLDPNAKIIAMSGVAEGRAHPYLTLALRLGASSALEKPFSREEVLTAIAEVLTDKDGSR
jgi:DNA-binding response OmpR family regulator